MTKGPKVVLTSRRTRAGGVDGNDIIGLAFNCVGGNKAGQNKFIRTRRKSAEGEEWRNIEGYGRF